MEVESIKKWLRNAADHMAGHSKRMKKMLEKKRQRAVTAGAVLVLVPCHTMTGRVLVMMLTAACLTTVPTMMSVM